MIKWAELGVVALATVGGAGLVVVLYSLGVRLSAVAGDPERPGGAQRMLAKLCFVLCGAVVLFGVYLVIPYFRH